jgi:PAS domain S-box-containing protein
MLQALKSHRRLIVGLILVMAGAAMSAEAYFHWNHSPQFRRPMRIGFGDDVPIHFRGPDGLPQGFGVDLLDEAANRAGIKLEWVYAPERPDAALASGRVDLWPLIGIVPEREGRVYFSEPWVTSTYAIASRRSNPMVPGRTPADLTIARSPSNIERIVCERNFPKARLIEKESQAEAMNAVCSGEADAVLSSEPFDDLQKRKNCDGVPLVVSGLPDGMTYFGIGAKYQSREARMAADALRSQMTKMAEDGTLQSIVFRWSYRDGAEIAAFFNLLDSRRHARLLSCAVLLLGIVLSLLALLGLRVMERTRALQREISDRKRAEEALVRSEEDFRSLVENAPCGIYRASFKEDRLLSVNPSLMKTLRYSSPEELLNLRLSRDLYVDPQERNALFAAAECGKIFARDVAWRRHDGTAIKVRVTGRLVEETDTGDKIVQFVSEDITDRSLLEEQLRQSHKMDAVGRLAGGVAHDFNNILAIIMGHSELLQCLLDTADPIRKRIGQITEAAMRGSALTQQLLAYSRKQVLKTEILNVNAVLNNMAQLLQRVIGEDINLILRFRADVGCINSDRSRIEQILLNLAINSRDAMPGGGTLTLETQNIELNEDNSSLYPGTVVGSHVKFAVTDTGCGIAPESLSHIFEPFFTTKGHGKGTGLGLSTVYGIVRQSGGVISVKSEVGKGTTVEILLPRVPNDNLAQEDMPRETREPARGSETVLVVEDEKELLQLAAEALELLGYKVLTASDGYQGIQVAESHEGKIDLVLTDVIMPGMSGWDLAKALRSFCPSIKTLFMSGYTAGVIAKQGVLEPGTFLLEKPFKSVDMAARVRELLDAREQASPPECMTPAATP